MGLCVSPEELAARIGQELGVSDWLAVSQEKIDDFASSTEDYQFLHVDPERAAAETAFGGTIAHGFLTLSLVPLLQSRSDVPRCAGMAMVLNYGVDNLRFLAPVRSGKRIRGRFRLLEFKEQKPGRWQQVLGVTVEIEDENKPALVGEWTTLMIA